MANHAQNFSTPVILARPYIQFSQSQMEDFAEHHRINLQQSALPQMSEIPMEDRVQYAYLQQVKL